MCIMINMIVHQHIETVKHFFTSKSDVVDKLCEISLNTIKRGNKIIVCGNGGSAADAQHIAAEFIGRFYRERKPLPALALTVDTSAITCIANDYSYDNIFDRQLQGIGSKGDLLIGISTSGNSKNVVNAVNMANEMGIYTVTFTGNNGGIINSLSNLPINVPSDNTARIQEVHIMIGHIMCQYVDEKIGSF